MLTVMMNTKMSIKLLRYNVQGSMQTQTCNKSQIQLMRDTMIRKHTKTYKRQIQLMRDTMTRKHTKTYKREIQLMRDTMTRKHTKTYKREIQLMRDTITRKHTHADTQQTPEQEFKPRTEKQMNVDLFFCCHFKSNYRPSWTPKSELRSGNGG